MKRFRFLFGVMLAVLFVTSPLARAFPQYYELQDQEAAKAEAKQRKLPLAWVASEYDVMNHGFSNPGSAVGLTQMAMETMKDQAVIILLDSERMYHAPPFVIVLIHTHDADKLPSHRWVNPKIVFTDPAVTKNLGIICHAQLAESHDIPIISALRIIAHDPTSLAAGPPQPEISHKVAPAQDADNFTPGTILEIVLFLAVGGVVAALAFQKRI